MDIKNNRVQADQMIAALIAATSFEHLEEVDAYVNALESTVFEILSRHVDASVRGHACLAYKKGIEAGLYGTDLVADRAVSTDSTLAATRKFGRLLEMIVLTGRDHGSTIRQYISSCRGGAASNVAVSGEKPAA
ncbi:hypothetical protein LFL97_40725 (plasmid) [Burkholderia sp. JSH-S8]|nr:hypothetical protein LFL97_40725 [Burkholderia sp. JSH-S8]